LRATPLRRYLLGQVIARMWCRRPLIGPPAIRKKVLGLEESGITVTATALTLFASKAAAEKSN
jgi:hypothetical protein